MGDMSTDADVTAWVPDDSTFGARLALVRQRMGWNLKEAALGCGVKYATWRDWELKGREPHKLQNVCRQIASCTGCNHLWLMTGDPIPTPPVPPAGFEPAAFCSQDLQQENVVYLQVPIDVSETSPTAIPA